MGNPPPPESGRGLAALFDWMTGRLPWRPDARPFPLIVLEPAGPDDPEPHMEELRHLAAEMALPFVSPEAPAGPDSDAAAIALADALSQPITWSRTRSQFSRPRFPRSDLVRTIERAAAPAPDDGDAAPPYRRSPVSTVERWNDHAGLFRWQGGPLRAPAWWSTIGASLVAVIAVLAGGIAEQTPRRILVTAAAVLAGVLLLVAGLSARRVWLPVLASVGIGGRYRWFARTSFFAALGDEDGDDLGFDGRLHRVAERLTEPGAARFLLHIKTFALLEDVRDQYRRFAPSLRGFKRPAPLVVFLSHAGHGNGGLALLAAMSDIRARRSELHPLLVVASVDAATRDAWLGGPTPGEDARDRYERWRSSLGAALGPSESVPLPWLLRVPVAGEPAADRPDGAFRPRRRPRWTWLWSWRGLIAAAVAFAIALTFAQVHLRSTYCSVGFPVGWNGDTRQQTNPDGSRECVGVSTRGVRFERGADSIALDGDRRRPSPANAGGHITLADLQRDIDKENRAVVADHQPYVTMIYAGTFTASPGQSELTVSSVHELAGAYLAQLRNNHRGQPGEIGNTLKLRILPANTGQDMAFAGETADRALHLARRDPSIVGVVGLGRNTRSSRAAIERLTAAGLPVIDTVNSSDELPGLARFYGLAATNREEATAGLAALRDAGLRGRVDRAMIVARTSGPPTDVYSSEIARDVVSVLRPRAPHTVGYRGPGDISSKVKAACDNGRLPYTLVYFAGRAEDLPGLMNGLVQGGCTRHRLLLIAGDDVSKSRFGTGPHEVPLPQNTTLYHTVFAYLPHLIAKDADVTGDFFLMARNRFGIGAPRVRPDEPLLVDGQMAITFDATFALSQAAQNAYDLLGPRLVTGERSVTSGTVLEELRHLRITRGGSATGDIDFTNDHGDPPRPRNRGLTLVKVTLKDGRPQPTAICGRLGGGVPVEGLRPC
ncbi:hypothetical protein [Actinomadura sp. NEAU-AAG7]|uniref:hypothetical protein n=1 Tax=Actinomadura sp. NEAU-AAG7 TaxID=2839640 RepID=UPI001BE3D10C|nr:hypothetical protein [Actinomadura sp. NEAU-AAG7]MBT2209930.1 hypothetical protein [Actinomadura sp. NEAU-AAG7]